MVAQTLPIPVTIIQDDFTIDTVAGGPANDYLIHHRDPGVVTQDGTGIAGYAGDDILEGSVPDQGQIHMFGAAGNDWFILDVTKVEDALGTQGHHAYGGSGEDTFQFTNIEQNLSPIIGRLDDFDPTSDRIIIEDTEIDLNDLPLTVQLADGSTVEVRVIEVEHAEFIDEKLGSQQFLAIGDDIFYALEGARDLCNGTSGQVGEERHFMDATSLDTLRSAETVQYENPNDFVPRDFYEHREDELTLNETPDGPEVTADTGDLDAVHMFGGKSSANDPQSTGHQVMHGSDGDDVIDADTGNDTIYGGGGQDLISGGIDNDVVHSDDGNDMVWGGDGEDIIDGGKGNDFVEGGKGDDTLYGGQGDDTLVGGSGDDSLEGGGGEDAVNRFHFYEEGGNDTISDFKVGVDSITFQDDIDPLTVEIYQNEDGNTVLNYGQTGSVELLGVPLDAFEEAAELRAGEDDPIVSITTDPEEEALQDVRIESGYYGDAEPPSLMVDDLAYGATPFQDTGAGGYTYVSQEEGDDGRADEDCLHEHEYCEHDDHGNPIPPIPVVEEEEEPPVDDEQPTDQGTCFVATAAYGDPTHPDVIFLRAFRDQWLVKRAWGRAFIALYWRVGPKMAGCVRRSPRLAAPSKRLIAAIVVALRKCFTEKDAVLLKS